jgi:hypothetical protein
MVCTAKVIGNSLPRYMYTRLRLACCMMHYVLFQGDEENFMNCFAAAKKQMPVHLKGRMQGLIVTDRPHILVKYVHARVRAACVWFQHGTWRTILRYCTV